MLYLVQVKAESLASVYNRNKILFCKLVTAFLQRNTDENIFNIRYMFKQHNSCYPIVKKLIRPIMG